MEPQLTHTVGLTVVPRKQQLVSTESYQHVR